MLKFNAYAGNDETLTAEKTAAIFKKRYRLGFWCALVPFCGVWPIPFLVIKHKSFELILAMVFLIFVLTIFAYVHFIYRCPRCGTVPKSSEIGTTGILFVPKKCNRCQAPLLPNHRWGQD